MKNAVMKRSGSGPESPCVTTGHSRAQGRRAWDIIAEDEADSGALARQLLGRLTEVAIRGDQARCTSKSGIGRVVFSW